jgi:glycosyltransferase involved in cell wall biosynthesis
VRVALISSGSGSRGGGEIYLRFLADGLVQCGCEVHALIPAAARMDELAHSLTPVARVTRLPMTATYERRLRNIGAFFDAEQQIRVARALQDVVPDVIHVNQQVAEDGLDFVAGADRTGLPWISTIHIAHTARALGARIAVLRDAVTTRALRRRGAVYVTVSHASQAQLSARFVDGPTKPRVLVVHNGVPVQKSSALLAAREAARREWGIADGEVVIGAVGRIEAQKNPLALVAHVRDLIAKGNAIRLVWIGDGKMRSELEEHAAGVLGTSRLIVDGWRSDAAMQMAGFDIFAMPSLFEGLPLALLEAMHAGLPIVATRTDGTPEAIDHGVTGLLCSDGDEFAQALQRLAGDIGLRTNLGKAARDVARQRFSSIAMAEKLLEIYKEQVSARRARSS